jgi:ribulose-phosphate 3-epimerase
MHRIIPGILEKSSKEIERKLEIIKPFSSVVHIDIIDGKFNTNENFRDPDFFKKFSNDFFLEVHLMVDDPLYYLKPFANAGFKRFLGHSEKMPDLIEFIAMGQVLGEVGLAFDLDTNIDSIKIPYDDLDVLLLMGVKAGESGQDFSPKILDKIKAVREKSQIEIEVDGGINDKTIVDAKNAGATRFVTTSFIFNADDPMKEFGYLSSLI